MAVVTARRPQLNAVAQAWLTLGATSFAIWGDGERLAAWPPVADAPSAYLAAPVIVAGRPTGELRLAGLEGDTWRLRLDADARLLAHLVEVEADLEGITAELIDQQDQLLALYELTQSTRSHLDIDQMLLSVAREAGRLTKADGAILVFGADGDQMIAQQHPQPLLDHDALAALFRVLLGAGRDLLLNMSTPSIPFPPPVRSLVSVPIEIRGQLAALLLLVNKVDGGFIAADLKLARAIADHAGAQLENLLLYQETLAQAQLRTELDLAAKIQLRLLPQAVPREAGLDIGAASRPALQVGGDFYDLIQRPHQPFVFVVGDVSGKGMSAALLMAMSRTVIRSNARSEGAGQPVEIIERVNEDLYDDFTEVGMFATTFIAQYDHARREVDYVNAGHSPVIYCPADGDAQLLQADGTAVGVLPISLCEQQSLRMADGDVLLVASDGLSEARDAKGDLFGYDRLLRLAEALRTKAAKEIVAGFLDAVERFGAGHPQDDDQTLVVVKGIAV